MYGLVNKAIEDLAILVGGYEAWERIQDVAGLSIVEFISSDVYDDDVTYRLVDAASEVLGMPAHEVLRAFGRHWVLYTGRHGWGPIMSSFGDTLEEFVGNLDSLHARVSLTLPSLRPPRFAHRIGSDGALELTYSSVRAGLTPMAVGLIEGLGEMFGEPVDVTVLSTGEDEGRHVTVFGVRPKPAVTTPAATASVARG